MKIHSSWGKDGAGRTLPLKFDGFEIGTAVISKDGKTLTAELNDTNVSKEIQKKFLDASVSHFSIKPRTP